MYLLENSMEPLKTGMLIELGIVNPIILSIEHVRSKILAVMSTELYNRVRVMAINCVTD